MKKNITLLSASILVLLAVGFLFSKNDQTTEEVKLSQKQLDIRGYAEYMGLLRNNQNTGTYTTQDVLRVVGQMKAESRKSHKAEWPVLWDFTGPDNTGGRTRALCIDKDDSKILYCGGVSGGLFKSTNRGASWRPVTMEDANFGVTAVAQSSDGSIYYGTGEGSFVTTTGSEDGSPGFRGMGIFKSSNGEDFELLTSTTNLGNINILIAHSDNKMFAGTSSGLYLTEDGGDNWERIRPGNCRDFQINSNNVALAYLGTQIWRSTIPDDADAYSLVSAFDANTRMAIAWGTSNPDYAYIVSVNRSGSGADDGALNGLYQSTDAGVNWTKVVQGTSTLFAPMLGAWYQGQYDLAIGVDPRDEERVFIGGVHFAEWTPTKGPKIVGNNLDNPQNPFGIHPDKHFITFDNSGDVPIMYIGTDGGVYRTTNETLDRYAALEVGFITTQFYGIAASIDGVVIGGTQDNRTLLLDGKSYPRKIATEILGGDGFHCEISQYNTAVMFATSTSGSLVRSVNGGSSVVQFFDDRSPTSSAYFSTPMFLWENPEAIAQSKDFGRDTTTDKIYESRFFYAFNDGVWMANNATGTPFNEEFPSDNGVRWFKVASIPISNNRSTYVHELATTKEGNSLFISRRNGELYRVDGLNHANWNTNEISKSDGISDSLNITEISGNLPSFGRVITSIAVDPNDDNRVVVTLGSYNNNDYVFVTENALDPNPTWSSIQGNLPEFPVYASVIDMTDPDVIIVGTEFGVWATNNGTSSNPNLGAVIRWSGRSIPIPTGACIRLGSGCIQELDRC